MLETRVLTLTLWFEWAVPHQHNLLRMLMTGIQPSSCYNAGYEPVSLVSTSVALQASSGTNQHHSIWANDTNMYKIALLVKIFDVNFFKMVMLPRHTSSIKARTQNYKATSESAYTACGKLLVQQYKNRCKAMFFSNTQIHTVVFTSKKSFV